MDYNMSNTNDKIIKNLVLDFVGKTEKKSYACFIVLRETKSGYVVRILQSDDKICEKTERTGFITREAFELGIRCGYLKKTAEKSVKKMNLKTNIM